jgi:hypothetical protein
LSRLRLKQDSTFSGKRSRLDPTSIQGDERFAAEERFTAGPFQYIGKRGRQRRQEIDGGLAVLDLGHAVLGHLPDDRQGVDCKSNGEESVQEGRQANPFDAKEEVDVPGGPQDPVPGRRNPTDDRVAHAGFVEDVDRPPRRLNRRNAKSPAESHANQQSLEWSQAPKRGEHLHGKIHAVSTHTIVGLLSDGPTASRFGRKR